MTQRANTRAGRRPAIDEDGLRIGAAALICAAANQMRDAVGAMRYSNVDNKHDVVEARRLIRLAERAARKAVKA